MTDNLFEIATREAYRFDSPRGELTVEQLWNLPLTAPGNQANKLDLDTVAKAIHTQLRDVTEISFVGTTSNNTKATLLSRKLDLVKYIIQTKQAEQKTRSDEAARQAQIKQFESVLADKRDASIRDMSVEQLEAKLAELRSAGS